MLRLRGVLLLALLPACHLVAADQPTEAPALAQACLQCHQNGGAAAIPGWPPLTAMSSEEIVAKLSGYRDRQVSGSRMTAVAHDLTDEEIRQLSEHFGRKAAM
jgi:cytochrome c553